MCGIAGMVRKDGRAPDREVLASMGRAMAHRGPDGEGFFVDGSVGLVHRRLAIIDLATGDQPMFNEDGSVLTVFNGEIYNFQELAPGLARAGHTFKTRSDTEVIVHGWEEWGKALPEHLNGMFAVVVYDRKEKELLLARDRLGVKPLYLFDGPEALIFASELAALLASGMVPREIDPAALELYLHYQYVPAPLTIYRGVSKLEPGERAIFKEGKLSRDRFWDLAADRPPEMARSLGEWTERLAALLDDAVRIRLISDVPFGAFLSGGTDSGIVVATMARHLREPVRTFSIGLADGGADELPRARQVAERVQTNHREFRVSPEGLTLIPRLAVHFGEPFADSSAVPTWYVSREARTQVKMVLTGDGGDEMFGGYRLYSGLAGADLAGLASARPVPLANGRLGDLPAKLYRRARAFAARVKRAALGRGTFQKVNRWDELYDLWMSHFGPEERRAVLGGRVPLSPSDFVTARYRFGAADSAIAAAQYCDLKSYLPHDVLTKVDRMSMAHSLEVRSPLLDYRIAELAFSMPTSMKVPEAWPDGRRGKYILKELAARSLGREYVYAPKEGFGIPVDRWLREDKAGYLRDVLGGESPVYGWLERPVVKNLISAHLEGRADHSAKLWNLLMLDAWFREVHAPASARSLEAKAV